MLSVSHGDSGDNDYLGIGEYLVIERACTIGGAGRGMGRGRGI
jgi:hypothetical protein